MFKPTKVIDVELSRPLESIVDLDNYGAVQVLVRLHGAPIGYVTLPLIGGRCSATALSKAILERHTWGILRHLLSDGLAAVPSGGLRIADLVNVSHPVCSGAFPSVTVAVCTRDRTANLAICLDALSRLNYPTLDLLVVDNAPSSDATERLVRSAYPRVRYVQEPRPGLDWARNRAILEARGEIIAYTDDDVIVDTEWVRALATAFAEHPEVMAVTGLVVPYELETEAQVLFERYGGFGRGFERKWYRVDRESDEPVAPQHGGTGKFGTGANMAYRRSLFEQIDVFDPALDVGTVTNGGGDLEMFFRVLKAGHTLMYEPSAIVRHRHRREYGQLRTQLTNNGIGLWSYFMRSAFAYPEERFAFLRFGCWWLWYWLLRRLLDSLIRSHYFPRDLILAELRGALLGLGRYRKARRIANEIASSFGPMEQIIRPEKLGIQKSPVKRQSSTAVRTVDLSQPLRPLSDVKDYSSVRVFVTWNGHLFGRVDIPHCHQLISASRLCEAIAASFGLKVIEPARHLSMNILWADAQAALTRHYTPTENGTAPVRETNLPADVSVSIVVATHDRPDDLRNCLRCLTAQTSTRYREIIVVDNNPTSGLTPPVVAEFPGARLVNEFRKGLAYARNAGFVASTGEIVVTTDDDVTVPPGWLERLVAPFTRPEVMVVTGNVLPLELETAAQRLFESYGGLGRGFEPRSFDRSWFNEFKSAVPTWEIGATANAAFRAIIFNHPQIGLMDEALGPGMPSGVGEDTYLFYAVLKAGYMIVYEPAAYVWHRHRCDMPALRRQIYNYSKGHVAYHLTTFLRDHDRRALVRLVIKLPRIHFWRAEERMRGRSSYPLSLILLEIAGNLAGPWALWRSRRRVKREGRSDLYLPVSQRSAIIGEASPIVTRGMQSANLQGVSGQL